MLLSNNLGQVAVITLLISLDTSGKIRKAHTSDFTGWCWQIRRKVQTIVEHSFNKSCIIGTPDDPENNIIYIKKTQSLIILNQKMPQESWVLHWKFSGILKPMYFANIFIFIYAQ